MILSGTRTCRNPAPVCVLVYVYACISAVVHTHSTPHTHTHTRTLALVLGPLSPQGLRHKPTPSGARPPSPPPSPPPLEPTLLAGAAASIHRTTNRNSNNSKNRRQILGAAAATVFALLSLNPARARVYLDADVYGDKELKVATVNKIKQKIRNAILQDQSLAPQLLKIAINDALGYIDQTDQGGPDGSILFEASKEENASLERGLNALKKIKQEVARTNVVSLADLVALGGAVAIESVGGPRTTVQLGRYDSKVENAGARVVNWGSPQSSGVKEAFESSGLSAREAALLIGAIGEVERAVQEAKPVVEESDEDEFVDEEQLALERAVPTTFGARDDIYGSKIGSANFSNGYLSSLLVRAKKGGALTPLEQAVLGDDAIRSWVVKYADNNSGFVKDVSEAYGRLTLLGSAYITRNS